MDKERKRSTFHLPGQGTIRVNPDQHWHCFKGNLGVTSGRWDGARMGLPITTMAF